MGVWVLCMPWGGLYDPLSCNFLCMTNSHPDQILIYFLKQPYNRRLDTKNQIPSLKDKKNDTHFKKSGPRAKIIFLPNLLKIY